MSYAYLASTAGSSLSRRHRKASRNALALDAHLVANALPGGIDPGDADGLVSIGSLAPLRLHSAVVASDDGRVRTVAFHAAFAASAEDFARALRDDEPEGSAGVMARLGFDPGHPLLSGPLVDLLSAAAPPPEGGWLRLDIRLDRASAAAWDRDAEASSC